MTMAKQSIKQRETQVPTDKGVGKQIEQTFTVEDVSLPSPQELEAYKQINPQIIDFLLPTSTKEQEHRHQLDEEKLKVLENVNKRDHRLNLLGMIFGFLSLLVMMGVACYMLYLNHPWFASFFGGVSLITVISIFVTRRDISTKKVEEK